MQVMGKGQVHSAYLTSGNNRIAYVPVLCLVGIGF